MKLGFFFLEQQSKKISMRASLITSLFWTSACELMQLLKKGIVSSFVCSATNRTVYSRYSNYYLKCWNLLNHIFNLHIHLKREIESSYEGHSINVWYIEASRKYGWLVDACKILRMLNTPRFYSLWQYPILLKFGLYLCRAIGVPVDLI